MQKKKGRRGEGERKETYREDWEERKSQTGPGGEETTEGAGEEETGGREEVSNEDPDGGDAVPDSPEETGVHKTAGRKCLWDPKNLYEGLDSWAVLSMLMLHNWFLRPNFLELEKKSLKKFTDLTYIACLYHLKSSEIVLIQWTT